MYLNLFEFTAALNSSFIVSGDRRNYTDKLKMKHVFRHKNIKYKK